eukprot:750961-Hanusia_phi.AAC.1
MRWETFCFGQTPFIFLLIVIQYASPCYHCAEGKSGCLNQVRRTTHNNIPSTTYDDYRIARVVVGAVWCPAEWFWWLCPACCIVLSASRSDI